MLIIAIWYVATLIRLLPDDRPTAEQRAFERDAELLRQDNLRLNGFIK